MKRFFCLFVASGIMLVTVGCWGTQTEVKDVAGSTLVPTPNPDIDPNSTNPEDQIRVTKAPKQTQIGPIEKTD